MNIETNPLVITSAAMAIGWGLGTELNTQPIPDSLGGALTICAINIALIAFGSDLASTYNAHPAAYSGFASALLFAQDRNLNIVRQHIPAFSASIPSPTHPEPIVAPSST